MNFVIPRIDETKTNIHFSFVFCFYFFFFQCACYRTQNLFNLFLNFGNDFTRKRLHSLNAATETLFDIERTEDLDNGFDFENMITYATQSVRAACHLDKTRSTRVSESLRSLSFSFFLSLPPTLSVWREKYKEIQNDSMLIWIISVINICALKIPTEDFEGKLQAKFILFNDKTLAPQCIKRLEAK